MSEKRRVLGRGLGALIPTGFTDTERRPPDAVVPGQAAGRLGQAIERPHLAKPSANTTEHSAEPEMTGAEAGVRPIPGVSFGMLPIAAIRPNPRQPRTTFDEDDLAELAASITHVGVLQPVVVRRVDSPDENGDLAYELVVGERRWRAASLAGLTRLPAIVKSTADDQMLRDALVENLHRCQLNPLEEAAAYDQLINEFDLRHDELADRVGKSRSHVTNTLRLMKLPAAVARRLAAGVISAGHARALLGIEEPDVMERMAHRIVAEGLSVRAVEELIALNGHQETAERRRRAVEQPPELAELASRLGDTLETRVHISVGQRRGRLTVDFAGLDDLDRILSALGLAEASLLANGSGMRQPAALTG